MNRPIASAKDTHEGNHMRHPQHHLSQYHQLRFDNGRRARRLAAEHHQDAVLQDEAQPERQLHDHQELVADHRPDQEPENQRAERRHHRHCDEDRHIRIERQRRIERQTHEHPERDEIAVGEVDHAADAVDAGPCRAQAGRRCCRSESLAPSPAEIRSHQSPLKVRDRRYGSADRP